jgi:hypothetical protein
MSEFEPDDIFTDIDLGADFLDAPDVPIEPGDTDIVAGTEVVSEAWFMDIVPLAPADNAGGLAIDVVLPDPFKAATGAGAAVVSAWMSRKAAGVAKRATTRRRGVR